MYPKHEYDFQQYSERVLLRFPRGCLLDNPSGETLQRGEWLRSSSLPLLQLTDPSLEGPTLSQIFPAGWSTMGAEVEAFLEPDHFCPSVGLF